MIEHRAGEHIVVSDDRPGSSVPTMLAPEMQPKVQLCVAITRVSGWSPALPVPSRYTGRPMFHGADRM